MAPPRRLLPKGHVSILDPEHENRLSIDPHTGKLHWDGKEIETVARTVIDFRSIKKWWAILTGFLVFSVAAASPLLAFLEGTCQWLDWHSCRQPNQQRQEVEQQLPPPPPNPTCSASEFRRLFFDSSSSTLSLEAAPALEEALVTLACDPNLRVEIQGHTDSSGASESNLKISSARADTVAGWLVRHGVAPDRVLTRAFGAAAPVADNSTPEGRAANRRVEILKR